MFMGMIRGVLYLWRAVIVVRLRLGGTIFWQHCMASSRIATKRQSKDHKCQNNFHLKNVSIRSQALQDRLRDIIKARTDR